MSNATATSCISIRDVSHYFGSPDGTSKFVALANASLEIRKGELLSLIGPSGCGKSTLLNAIGGLMKPSQGTILVEGQQVVGPLPKKIAFIFQENALFPWRTILENINLAQSFQGIPRSEREARSREVLNGVGLSAFVDHYPSQLSGGMKQRAQLARALALNTNIILMDEPFGALDEQTRMVLGEDLSALLSRTGKTIVFVTHSLSEAVFLADRVAVFTARPGRIKEIISVDEPHPRGTSFMTSDKLGALRNTLYELLHEEIRETMAVADKPDTATKARP